MKTSFNFNSSTGFMLTFEAENRAEEAILHLLWERQDRLKVMQRDTSFHESYQLTRIIELAEIPSIVEEKSR